MLPSPLVCVRQHVDPFLSWLDPVRGVGGHRDNVPDMAPPVRVSIIIAAGALSLSFNICFLVLLPVTLDRSISVFLLAQIEQHQDEGLDNQKLATIFVDKYVGDMDQIDRRVVEQTLSGNIRLVDGHVRLTEQGHRFLALSRNLAGVFGTDPRFVGLSPADKRKALASKATSH